MTTLPGDPTIALLPRHPSPAPAPVSRFTVVAFDDVLRSDTTVAHALSDSTREDALGQLDQLAIEVIVDQVAAGAGPVAAYVQIEHSGDRIHWLHKNFVPEVSKPPLVSLSGPTYMEIGYDAGLLPSLAFVRLALTLTAVGGPVSAHVKITVTANDLHEREFAHESVKAAAAFNETLYNIVFPGGSHILSDRVKDLVPYLYFLGLHLVPIAGTYATAVVVPAGFEIRFNGDEDYILVKGTQVLWSSLAFAQPPPQPSGQPKVQASDPPPKVKFK